MIAAPARSTRWIRFLLAMPTGAVPLPARQARLRLRSNPANVLISPPRVVQP